jgi:hypothetical protein
MIIRIERLSPEPPSLLRLWFFLRVNLLLSTEFLLPLGLCLTDIIICNIKEERFNRDSLQLGRIVN